MVKSNSAQMKKILVLVGLMVLGSGLVWAQPQEKPELPEEASEVAEEKVEWLWKKDFPEEIKDIILEQKKVKKKVIKEGKEAEIEEEIIFPKAVITEKSIRFLDEEGKTKNKYETQRIPKVQKSKNEKFISITEATEFSPSRGWPTKIKTKIFSSDGTFLWEKELQTDEFGEEILPSPSGDYAALTNSMYADEFKILYPNMNDKKVVTPMPPESVLEVRVFFSNKGDVFISKIRGRENEYLIMYDKNGNEIWRKPFEALGINSIGEIVFSPDDSLIAISGGLGEPYYEEGISKWKGEDYLILLNQRGDIIWKVSRHDGIDTIRFSNDNTLLIGINTGLNMKKICLLQIRDGSLIWKYDGSSLKGDRFVKLVTTPNLDYFLIVTHTPYSNYEFVLSYEWIYLFNVKGEKIWEKKFPPYDIIGSHPPYSWYIPHIFLFDEGNVIVNTKDALKAIKPSKVKK